MPPYLLNPNDPRYTGLHPAYANTTNVGAVNQQQIHPPDQRSISFRFGGGFNPTGIWSPTVNPVNFSGTQSPTAGGAQPPLPWQQLRQPGMGFGVIDNPNWFQQQSQLPQGLPQQPIVPQQPQQPTTGFEDRPRPWQMTPRMSFNLRPPTSMQPNWRQAWNYQQQPQQQQLPSMQAPLKTSAITSYDWTS